MQEIIIEEYNPIWPQQFEKEKDRLSEALPPEIIIEHVGSTSVPGLAAKPVIDIMIGVPSLKMADQSCIEPIKALGYTYVPEYEEYIPERRYFRKLNREGIVTHHIHLVEHDSPWWRRHIQFRDYLRHHPEAIKEYTALKKKLAAEFTNMNEYANAKTNFIRKIEDLANESLME